jgi:hypothetical protein
MAVLLKPRNRLLEIQKVGHYGEHHFAVNIALLLLSSLVGPGNYDPSIDIKFKTAPAATFGNVSL